MHMPPAYTAYVYFDIQTGYPGQTRGRVIFRLYDDIVPLTANNFRKLAQGLDGDGKPSDKGYRYAPGLFHRIIPGFLIQGGDVVNKDGTGGESAYGGRFKDENFKVKHNKPFLLSMANMGPDSNGSQFFITMAPTPWLDGKHVVFGEVAEGHDLLKSIEKLGSESGVPARYVSIIASGVIDYVPRKPDEKK
ncbi:cyclophilin-like domain-containing protein [Mycena rebaudengoi]|nr:cyclophilin-like domain-containing protein [Mycena rebaudengoi]